jgi:hypothetical protein
VNRPKYGAETNHNAAGVGQGEVPQHRQTSTFKKLLNMVLSVISFSITIWVFVEIVKGVTEFKKKSATTCK